MSSSVDGVEASPDAGLSQFMAMNPLVDFDKMGDDRATSNLDKISGQLKRDAAAVEAAEQAIRAGKLSSDEALQALLYECHILCADEFDCHHPPDRVRHDECQKCGSVVPEIPGFEVGRRN